MGGCRPIQDQELDYPSTWVVQTPTVFDSLENVPPHLNCQEQGTKNDDLFRVVSSSLFIYRQEPCQTKAQSAKLLDTVPACQGFQADLPLRSLGKTLSLLQL